MINHVNMLVIFDVLTVVAALEAIVFVMVMKPAWMVQMKE